MPTLVFNESQINYEASESKFLYFNMVFYINLNLLGTSVSYRTRILKFLPKAERPTKVQ